MRTTASKVTRQTVGVFALTGKPTALVVTIDGDWLVFREKGKRGQNYRLPIEQAARAALLASVALPSFSLPPAAEPAPVPAPKPTPTESPTLL